MIEIDIPGYKKLHLKNLVLDYNGTLACDGEMLPGVKACLTKLAEELDIHVLTADTFGKARSGLNGIPCDLSILPLNRQDIGKLEVVERLDERHTVCIGNGRNDRLMLEEAVLGIAVIIGEGAAMECVTAADVVCSNILSALELLTNPLRLIATLRS
ncbi:MAG TPA: ATPase P [Desulfobacterales bacterium]|nr:ATPase P [Desulfobacterales bacterium]